jgi:cytochrome c oxidase assembly protein subunit 15
MPFDDFDFPTGARRVPCSYRRNSRWVASWLFVVAGFTFVMIVLGGATRLTGSGLSIMEWAPLSGALPPLSHAEWERLFGLYKQIPQYSLLHTDMDLAGFQRIFWLEWTHRLWGRLIGIVFLVPLIAFVVRGMIPRRLIPRLALLFVLGGLQGAVGWFMVASGFFPDSTAVSPYRLVVHLVLALALYAAMIWIALSLWRRTVPRGDPPTRPLARRMAAAVVGCVVLTIVAGGFTAGLHAGLTYNTFPLMDGSLVPAGYAPLEPPWRSFFEDVATVQFDHRLLATLTAALTLAAVAIGLASGVRGTVRRAFLALGAVVLVQYMLGVATLLNVVPVGLAVAHQATAVLLLTAALVACHATRRAPAHPELP